MAPGQHTVSRPSLVGRATELNTLVAALTAADSGAGSTVFVVGESGIGKTKLVAEGITARFVRDVATHHGKLLEKTADWYARPSERSGVGL